MKKKMLGVLLLLALTIQFAVAQKKAVIAYYSGSLEALDKYTPQSFTHIIYCFGRLKDGKLHLRGMRDTMMIQKMVAMKVQNSKLKVLLSLGGWGGCAPCSETFSTQEGINTFVASVKSLTDYFKSDGIDLDWEYPSISGYPGHRYDVSDKQNFTALILKLREVLGRKKTITFAAGGFTRYLDEAVDWGAVMPLVNYVNLMTYDLVGGYSKVTGHHTPLYSTPKQKGSADHCVSSLLAKGVSSKKLILGAAFYARTWEGVSPQDNGLYQSGKFKYFIGYNQFSSRISNTNGYVEYWDEEAMAPYAYNAAEKSFATYDNQRSIEAKSKYVLQKKLGGIMFWQLGHDFPDDGLLSTINSTLGKRK